MTLRITASQLKCDVLVIGAGPAGSSAAYSAAQAGARVILIDRRRQIGLPVKCAGFLPLGAISSLPGFDLTAGLSVSSMRAFMPDGSEEFISSPGYIIHRDRLDQWLALRAKTAGAIILSGTRAFHIMPGESAVTVSARSSEGPLKIQAGIVVGADGPRSLAGAAAGCTNQSFMIAAQWTVPLLKPLQETRVYFERVFSGGYGWLFPAGCQFPERCKNMNIASGNKLMARIGVGLGKKSGANPKQALEWFIDKLAGEGMINARPLSVTGGLIPVGGLESACRQRIILAGDAAGLCHPLTGAGIWSAIYSGRLAGTAAAAATKAGDTRILTAYAREIKDIFGDSLSDAVLRRKTMYKLYVEPDEQLSTAVRQAWFDPPVLATLAT